MNKWHLVVPASLFCIAAPCFAVDTTPPSTPAPPQATTVLSTSIKLSWPAATDASGINGYGVLRNGTLVGKTRNTYFTNTGLTPSTAYSYTLIAEDKAGNRSPQSVATVVTTPVPDTTPPSKPDNLSASAISLDSIGVSWRPSTDSRGIKGYGIVRDGHKVGQTTGLHFVDKGLVANKAYVYTVVAEDKEGNRSAASQPLSARTSASVTVLVNENFDTPGHVLSNFGGENGVTTVELSTDRSKNYNGSAGSIRGVYLPRAAPGHASIWGGYDIPPNNRDVFIEFWAKMPAVKHGFKFVKIFGRRTNDAGTEIWSGNHYANSTFGVDYTGIDLGGMYAVSFGDGTEIANDTAAIVLLDGSPSNVGRSNSFAHIATPQMRNFASSMWGTGWHHFRMRAKFNSGTSAQTEVADGAFYLEIDGKVYADASNLFNRHYSNAPIESVGFFGWTQNGSEQFEVWYDDIRISLGGFVSDAH